MWPCGYVAKWLSFEMVIHVNSGPMGENGQKKLCEVLLFVGLFLWKMFWLKPYWCLLTWGCWVGGGPLYPFRPKLRGCRQRRRLDLLFIGVAMISASLTRTQLRRQQRKHSELSYRALKHRLVAVVTPAPASALKALDLEHFRAQLFSPVANASEKHEVDRAETVAPGTTATIADMPPLWCMASSARLLCDELPKASS